MKTYLLVAAAIACVWVSACTTSKLFPQEVMEGVAPSFQFEAWRDAAPSNSAGISDGGLRVQLGGRIVRASQDSTGVVIVAEQLPIVQHPAYGPTEDVNRMDGDYEFAFLYPGELPPQTLRNGNRFIVVGTTTKRRSVTIDGLTRSEPFLVADCVHVWQTGRTEIAEFKEDVGGGYSPLRERTYCVAPKQRN